MLALLLATASRAGTISVTSTADTAANDGLCTLREAITAANTNTASGAMAGECPAGQAGLDTIKFDVSGVGCSGSPAVCTILSPLSPVPLPTITEPISIDGRTQAGYTNSPLIEIRCTPSVFGRGLRINAGGSAVRGLSITACVEGISLENEGSNTIEANWLGLTPAGAALENVDGIYLLHSDGNQIGGTSPAARNVISGNSNGIFFDNASSNNVVEGNFIGTDPAGGATRGGTRGIEIVAGSSLNRIGGTSAASRNVISGNTSIAIVISDLGTSGNLIQGNFIGTNAAGTAALANGDGVGVFLNASGNTIGGTSAGAGNVISGNTHNGVYIFDSGSNHVEGNRIGTDDAATLSIGNGETGVRVEGLTVTTDNRIGTLPSGGNVIAHNGRGIWVVGGTGNSLRGNSIFANVDLGIDLGGDAANQSAGPTLNDPADADDGPNHFQNFPAVGTIGAGSVSGAFQGAASTTFDLDFYASPACDPHGFGQGQTYLGSTAVTTNVAGDAFFTASLAVPAGQVVTATATDPFGNTSEFSRCGFVVAQALDVDTAPSAGSDGNGVLEAGETVVVAPSWKNATTSPFPDVSGEAALFGGPGSSAYTLTDDAAGYATFSASQTRPCSLSGDCYAAFVSTPAARPAGHWDASLSETLRTDVSRVVAGPKTWTLHVGESFGDVPRSQLFYRKIETIFHNGISVGCTSTDYCPSEKVPRSQMAIFIARGIAGGGSHVPVSGTLNGRPYDCETGGVSLFTDVAPTDTFCKSVHYIAVKNVTTGCAPSLYCSAEPVRRAAMAIFMAKAVVAPAGGPGVPLTYGPDPVTSLSYSCDPASPSLHFTDVAISDSFCKHVHYLWAKGIITGCAANQFCPAGEVARDEMAKFLGNSFDLKLYGP